MVPKKRPSPPGGWSKMNGKKKKAPSRPSRPLMVKSSKSKGKLK